MLTSIYFFLNLALFILTIICVTRYTLYKRSWSLMLHDSVQNAYLGCFPMGGTTLINVSVTLMYNEYGFGGKSYLYTIWAHWWRDVAGCRIARQDHFLDKMTAVWLLPVVTVIFPPSHDLITTLFSIALVTVGLMLAFTIMTIHLLCVIPHGLPLGGTIISTFIPLGPTGQRGCSVLLVGQSLKHFLPLHSGASEVLNSGSTGEIISVTCVCISFILWAIATMWLVYAMLGTLDSPRKARIPFKATAWDLIFPNVVVYANSNMQLYKALDLPFFRV
ncbi:hypothetical protein GLOTRDRAFT_104971 [Gloeophyllum trabeum ATCC 11539]|uniref:Uncharacterized protein n=1 Tax=Gloeophyllum trabeum (strain ATCC 11539 / FP-39264 / Madison 617) TaxID=670483 RepID=S7RS46_GLOTA|nr:uncharacterized protein GLOTRDRAFT_104971 [Gloeophyllum trabeum ATCC 11539]EPQ57450.1 hypothetical protein GLOTRDRAFT_104971 [Gloeophyllum trabeum ATCC 11539]